ncbi:hypothetical protein HRbin24_01374 [bacterium HR24]|nr:hypothetical protein HRbin24_01374 [bacterium HR24]
MDEVGAGVVVAEVDAYRLHGQVIAAVEWDRVACRVGADIASENAVLEDGHPSAAYAPGGVRREAAVVVVSNGDEGGLQQGSVAVVDSASRSSRIVPLGRAVDDGQHRTLVVVDGAAIAICKVVGENAGGDGSGSVVVQGAAVEADLVRLEGAVYDIQDSPVGNGPTVLIGRVPLEPTTGNDQGPLASVAAVVDGGAVAAGEVAPEAACLDVQVPTVVVDGPAIGLGGVSGKGAALHSAPGRRPEVDGPAPTVGRISAEQGIVDVEDAPTGHIDGPAVDGGRVVGEGRAADVQGTASGGAGVGVHEHGAAQARKIGAERVDLHLLQRQPRARADVEGPEAVALRQQLDDRQVGLVGAVHAAALDGDVSVDVQVVARADIGFGRRIWPPEQFEGVRPPVVIDVGERDAEAERVRGGEPQGVGLHYGGPQRALVVGVFGIGIAAFVARVGVGLVGEHVDGEGVVELVLGEGRPRDVARSHCQEEQQARRQPQARQREAPCSGSFHGALPVACGGHRRPGREALIDRPATGSSPRYTSDRIISA